MKKEVLNTVFGSCPVNMSDEDILDAMKSIPGYLDITPGDFKEIFNYAYGYAIERIAQSLQAKDIMTSPAQTVFEDTPITDLVMIIGSFGASAVLIYGVIRSPLAQPRNLIGGHVISAVIGVTTYKLIPAHL